MLDPRDPRPVYRGSILGLSQEAAEVALVMALALLPQCQAIRTAPDPGGFIVTTDRARRIQATITASKASLCLRWDMGEVHDADLAEIAEIRENTAALLPACMDALTTQEAA